MAGYTEIADSWMIEVRLLISLALWVPDSVPTSGLILLAKSSRYDKDQPLVKKGDLDGYGNKISSPAVETKILQNYFKKLDMKQERVSYR